MRVPLVIFYCFTVLAIQSILASNNQRNPPDPTASKTPDQVKEIVENLSSLTEYQLLAFGRTNTSACSALQKGHLEKGYPFRYILINTNCLGPANIEHLRKLLWRDKTGIRRTIAGNRRFWCPYARENDLSRWSVKDKIEIIVEGLCPENKKSSAGATTTEDNNRVLKGLLIAGIVLLSLIVVGIFITIVIVLAGRRRTAAHENKNREPNFQ